MLISQALLCFSWTQASQPQVILQFSYSYLVATSLNYKKFISPLRTRWPKLSRTLRLGYRKKALDKSSMNFIESVSQIFCPVPKELLKSAVTSKYGSNLILEQPATHVQPIYCEKDAISSRESSSRDTSPRQDVESLRMIFLTRCARLAISMAKCKILGIHL